MHYCAFHQKNETESRFRRKPNGLLDSWCIEGRREYNREYSRDKYQPIKEQNALLRELQKCKVCTGCNQEKLIDEFPVRKDRPGKHHARCFECRSKQVKVYNRNQYFSKQEDRINYAREYRLKNPEKHREAVRKRAKRKHRVRREDYTRLDIRTRDKGLCYFCGEWIDSSLKYPHPESQVIHHILPFSKFGPDSPENVAIAHHKCNGEEYTKYESPFRGNWGVRPISSYLARKVAIQEHYLHRAPNVSYAYGLFLNDDLKGIVTFGSTGSNRTAKSVCPDDVKAVIELSRLWISPDAPPHTGSWFVSRALKQLPPYIVISYADTGIMDTRNGRTHNGCIYKSLSFNYAGKTKPKIDWRLPGSTRNVGKKTPGSQPVRVTAKERYWTVTGNKRERRILYAKCQWPYLPYT